MVLFAFFFFVVVVVVVIVTVVAVVSVYQIYIWITIQYAREQHQYKKKLWIARMKRRKQMEIYLFYFSLHWKSSFTQFNTLCSGFFFCFVFLFLSYSLGVNLIPVPRTFILNSLLHKMISRFYFLNVILSLSGNFQSSSTLINFYLDPRF